MNLRISITGLLYDCDHTNAWNGIQLQSLATFFINSLNSLHLFRRCQLLTHKHKHKHTQTQTHTHTHTQFRNLLHRILISA